MTTEHSAPWLQFKLLLRDVHPVVWRRVSLPDSLSIADLHNVIQLLMGWDDDHLHSFASMAGIMASPVQVDQIVGRTRRRCRCRGSDFG